MLLCFPVMFYFLERPWTCRRNGYFTGDLLGCSTLYPSLRPAQQISTISMHLSLLILSPCFILHTGS